MAVTVGQLKQLLEFVKDDTEIYIEVEASDDDVFIPATISLDFVVQGDLPDERKRADPDSDLVDSEVGLLIW